MNVPALQQQLIQAFNQNDWPRVQQLSAKLIPLTKKQAMAPYMSGIAHMQLGDLPQAAELLKLACTLEPRADFLAQYSKVLTLMGLLVRAHKVADQAMAARPSDPFTLDTLGVTYSQSHAHEKAVQAFKRQLELAPQSASARFHMAYSLLAMGEPDAADEQLEACVTLDPRYWQAYHSLATLRRQTPQRNHVERLRALLAQYPSHPMAQRYLNVALGKELDDLGQYDDAFVHYTRGKNVGRERRTDSAGRDADVFARLIESFPLDAPAPQGERGAQVIFVVGLPRTGTTLIDRIISSHPQVKSAGELRIFAPELQRHVRTIDPVLTSAKLPELVNGIDWNALGEAYLKATKPYADAAPRFIDKMPHNFLYAGFIARALPGAKIVCLRRDPLDTCIGTFRHLFEEVGSSFYDYSFDLLDTGRYYIGFDRLMAHWRAALPGRVFELQYESLVDEQEATTRALLDFCELPWDERCLHPEQNEAPVNTPNAWQVRSPVYRGAIGRWRNYAEPMRELRSLLGEAGLIDPSAAA